MQIKNVSISRIKIKRNRRPVNREQVAQLAESIQAIGLLHPICVTSTYDLVSGRHRLKAFKLLKKKTIPAIITNKGLVADIAQIDENIIRADLTVLERGEQLQRRKELYEELHPQAKKAGPGRGHTEKKRNNFVSFSDDAAGKTGKSKRTIEQEVQIASKLSPEVKKSIRRTDLADRKADLLSLCRLEPEQQGKTVKHWLKNPEVSIDTTIKGMQKTSKTRQADKVRQSILRKSSLLSLSDEIKIHQGDCRKIFPKIISPLQKNFPEVNILVLCDPPYNVDFDGYADYEDCLPDNEYITMMKMFAGLPAAIMQYPEEMMSLVYPALGKPDEVLSWCYNTNLRRAFRLINVYNAMPDFKNITQPYKNPTDTRIRQLIKNGSPGARAYDWFSDIQLVKNTSRDKCFHPCQVPVTLMERLLLLLTKENDIVIDPFMGVGSTGLACQNLNRRFVGIEISEEYCRTAKYRFSQNARKRKRKDR